MNLHINWVSAQLAQSSALVLIKLEAEGHKIKYNYKYEFNRGIQICTGNARRHANPRTKTGMLKGKAPVTLPCCPGLTSSCLGSRGALEVEGWWCLRAAPRPESGWRCLTPPSSGGGGGAPCHGWMGGSRRGRARWERRWEEKRSRWLVSLGVECGRGDSDLEATAAK